MAALLGPFGPIGIIILIEKQSNNTNELTYMANWSYYNKIICDRKHPHILIQVCLPNIVGRHQDFQEAFEKQVWGEG